MSPASIEERLARLRPDLAPPDLRARVLSAARREWMRRSDARRAFAAAAWRWMAAVAAGWAICIGVSIGEDRATARSFAFAQPRIAPSGANDVLETLREAGMPDALVRMREDVAPDFAATSSWAVLRTRPVE